MESNKKGSDEVSGRVVNYESSISELINKSPSDSSIDSCKVIYDGYMFYPKAILYVSGNVSYHELALAVSSIIPESLEVELHLNGKKVDISDMRVVK